MSTMFPIRKKCSVCGHTAEQIVLGSTNSFGSPDLDLRPPEMQRSTMNLWVQECPSCGYAAADIEEPAAIGRAMLKEEAYRHTDGIRFRSGLAGRFYRQHLIAVRAGDPEAAFFALLHAAWACDDERDAENAVLCREKAILLLEQLLKDIPNDTLSVLKMDLLRRASRFEQLREEYSAITFSEPILERIRVFQLARAAAGDTACYTVQDT